MQTLYLYIKQHKITKLKYFGVTSARDPFRYNGSGVYWNRHIKKHGIEEVITLDVFGFDDLSLCREFALTFSLVNDIVDSGEWANLCLETVDGGCLGRKASAEQRRKLSESKLGKKLNLSDKQREEKSRISKENTKAFWDCDPRAEERRNALSKAHKNKVVSESTRQKLRNHNLGKRVDRAISEAWAEERKERRWYNDGVRSFHKNPRLEDVSHLIPGRIMNKANLKFKTTTKGYIRITDGTHNKTVPSDANIPDGWYRGQSKKK